MLKILLLTLVAAVQVQQHVQAAGCPRVVCYYTNWSQYRPGEGKYTPENVDPSLCTHINYAFAKIVNNEIKAFEWNDESTPWSTGMYEKFNNLKQSNPNLKTLISVGGWNMGSSAFTQMVSSAANRAKFINSAIAFLHKNKFDGLDFDWEYPANRGSPPQDKNNYILLLKETLAAFEKDAQTTGGPRLLLTAAVAAGKSNIDTAYDIPEISKYLDFINLMSYDLHGSWETHTGHNSPLYGLSTEQGDDKTLNVDWAANYWVQKGVPRDKLVIGVPTYGRSFTLQSTSQTGTYAPTRSKGNAGTYTREGGFLSYYEICKMEKEGGVKHQIDEQMVPYVVKGDQWIGYDDEDSLKEKVAYIKANNFGGVMVWALDLDDFGGAECGKGPYPLMHAINDACQSDSPGSKPHTQAPTAAPTSPAGPTSPPTAGPTNGQGQTYAQTQQSTANPTTGSHNIHTSEDFHCNGLSDGFYASKSSCVEYYICASSIAYKVRCAPGLVFNANTKFCDVPSAYHCTLGDAPTQPPQTQPPQTQPPQTQPPQTQPHQTQAPWTPPRPQATAASQTQGPGSQQVDLHNFCKGKSDGIHPDPSSCAYFFDCSNDITYRIPCAPGTIYNSELQTCDIPSHVHNCA